MSYIINIILLLLVIRLVIWLLARAPDIISKPPFGPSTPLPPEETLERVRYPGCPYCLAIHESDEDDRICSEVRRNFLAARITHLPMYHLQAREPVCCWCLGKHETEEDDQACLTLRSLLEDDQQE